MIKHEKLSHLVRLTPEIRNDLIELATQFGTVTLKRTIAELIQRYSELKILLDQENAKNGS